MKTAYLFPPGVKPEVANLGSAQLVDVYFKGARLRVASQEGRLRCSCEWCLAPLRFYKSSHFAHKAGRAKQGCPYTSLFKDGRPVLLLPLVQEMVNLHQVAPTKPWHVLFYPITVADLKLWAPWLATAARPEVPQMEPPPSPAALPSVEIH